MITFLDEMLVCRDCGERFVFSASEQEFYAVVGLQSEPRYCQECRERRRRYRNGEERTAIVCAACGMLDEVPFRPKGDRPVYCTECYGRIGVSN